MSDIGKQLFNACRDRNFDTVSELLESNPDVNINQVYVLFGTPYTLLTMAMEKNDILITQHLLGVKNIDVNMKVSGNAPIHLACKSKNEQIAKFLLMKHGINVNIQNDKGMTALMFACEEQNISIAKALLRRKYIDVNIQNNEGTTALMIACEMRCYEIIDLLLKNPKIDINLSNKKGDTAISIAQNQDYEDIVEIISEKYL